MQCVVACGAAVPWAMQVRLKRRHVVWGLSRRASLAAAREFVQFRKHKTMSPDPNGTSAQMLWSQVPLPQYLVARFKLDQPECPHG